jgi:hypothetical protein
VTSAPLQPPSAPIIGDSHGHLIPSVDALAGELGYRVCERDDTGAAGGWCDAEDKVIVINASLTANAKVRVRVHELAHALGIGLRSTAARRPRSWSTPLFSGAFVRSVALALG